MNRVNGLNLLDEREREVLICEIWLRDIVSAFP